MTSVIYIKNCYQCGTICESNVHLPELQKPDVKYIHALSMDIHCEKWTPRRDEEQDLELLEQDFEQELEMLKARTDAEMEAEERDREEREETR